MRLRTLAFAMALTACGASAPPTTTTASGTRFRVGDYVVYRYAGRLVGPEPMLLMEEVVSQQGERLVLEVTLSRGHDTVRAWRQTVIDTEENRAANHVEALCEIQGETCVALANEGNADLLRMYEGLFVTPDAPATEVAVTDATVDVGGAELACHVTRSEVVVAGEPRTIEETECPEFLWGHAGTLVEMPDKRRVLFVTVESFGPPR